MLFWYVEMHMLVFVIIHVRINMDSAEMWYFSEHLNLDNCFPKIKVRPLNFVIYNSVKYELNNKSCELCSDQRPKKDCQLNSVLLEISQMQTNLDYS